MTRHHVKMLNLYQGQVTVRGGWRLVFSNTHEVSISAIYVNDVIVQTAIESHSEK